MCTAIIPVYALLPRASRPPAGRQRQGDLVLSACMRCHDRDKLAGPDAGHWPAFGPGKSPEEWAARHEFHDVPTTPAPALTPDQVPQSSPSSPGEGSSEPRSGRWVSGLRDPLRRQSERKVTPGTRPTIRRSRPTALSGTRARRATGWVVSIPAQVRSRDYLALTESPRGSCTASGCTGSSPKTRTATIWVHPDSSIKHHPGSSIPKTGAVTKYTMPDPAAGGPHTPIFDQKGTLWFTMQQGIWSDG